MSSPARWAEGRGADAALRPSRRLVGVDRAGPLSWQQEGRLLRDAVRGERVPNIATAIPIPAEVDDALVRSRLDRIVEREDALRVVALSLADGIRYAESLSTSLPSVEVADRVALDALVERESFAYFGRDDGPLWSAALVRCASDQHGSGRYLCASFDHLITDGYSQALLVDELTAPPDATPDAPGGGSFRDWVRWQRDAFPRPEQGQAPSHRFWAATLDGTEPDRAATLSFCTAPDGELTGVVRSLRRRLPVSTSRLKRAAARASTTAFVLFLGVVAHAATRFSAAPDLTVRVNTVGRPTRFLDTHGFFADNLPVRLSGAALADPLDAVRATRSAWLRIVPHQVTPWDYLLAAFGRPGAGVSDRPAQALVNFLPWEQPAVSRLESEESEYANFMGTFQTVGALYDDDVCVVECEFDPARFAPDGVTQYLEALTAAVEQACERLGA